MIERSQAQAQIHELQQQLDCYAKCGEPKKLVKLPKCGHYDSYEFRNPETSQITYRETITWFKQYL